MREFIEKLLTRLLIVAAVLAAGSLIAQYGFFLPARYLDYLFTLDIAIITFFISENFIRLAISRERPAYFKSHWLDFAFIFLFAAQVISLRFFAASKPVSTFLAKLNIVSLTKAYIIAVQIYIGAALFSKTIDANRFIANLRLNPPQIVLVSFGLVIIVGTGLLLLPRATATGNSMPFVDALFTATSATCVTGLIVVDTGSYFSKLGQGIILLLIQLGGIGIMSLFAFSAVVMGRGIGVRETAVMKDILDSDFIGEVTKLVRNVVIITVICETIGVIVLTRLWAGQFSSSTEVFYFSLFHSISAFCNAGFSLFMDSLVGFRERLSVILTFAVLIVIGGLGFMVVSNLFSYALSRLKRQKMKVRLSLHTKLVLVATFVLLAFGTVSFLVLESSNALDGMTLGEKILTAFFTSVTARTAGFSTITMGSIATPTALVVVLLMFIGASPGGTGGGIKTSTFSVLIATIRSMVRGRRNVEIFRRSIPQDIVNKAICVVLLSLGLVFVSAFLISVIQGQSLTSVLFETVSAFGTVGLSSGLMRNLTTSGKIVIIITMFLGRIGPLTLGLAIRQRIQEQAYTFPTERVMIG